MKFQLFLLLLLSLEGRALPLAPPSGAEFSSPEPLTSFVTPSGTSRGLFVGGTNHLYQLDPSDLSVVRHVQTGPKLDSPSCHASGCGSDNSTAKLTDNVNKLLLVDQENDKLIACGSLFQVRLESFDLNSILKVLNFLCLV